MTGTKEPEIGSIQRVLLRYATAHSYLDALLIRADHPKGPTLRVIGFYDDELLRSPGGWVILHRSFRPIWREGNTALLRVPHARPEGSPRPDSG
jgi:hypothetical protein